MKLEYAVLGLLTARAMSGYDIKKWCAVEGKFVGLDRHPSQIYRELRRLRSDGLVDYDVDTRDSAPDAKVHHVTEDGVAHLTRWLDSDYVPPTRFQDPEFLIRLRFTAMLDPARARRLVEEELAARRRQVAENRGRPRPFDHIVGPGARPETDTRALAEVCDAVNRYGEQAIDAWIGTLEGMLGTLDALLADAGASR